VTADNAPLRRGDYVRGGNEHDPRWHAADPRWFEGTIDRVYDCGDGTRGAALRVERGSHQYKPGDHISYSSCSNLRRVPGPYALGDKMADRHPDSLIAQVAEKTIAKQVDHLATPINVRSPYAQLPPAGEPAFRLFERDGALYVDTQHGPVKISAATGELSPTRQQPNEHRFAEAAHSRYRPAKIDWANWAKADDASDPLDVEYDDRKLRSLLYFDDHARMENVVGQTARRCFTQAQREAVSSHWSAQLRAKVAAAAERERTRVVLDMYDLDD